MMPMTIGGVEIVITNDLQRYVFDKDWVLPCGVTLTFPDAYVDEMNAWAREVCGYCGNVVPDGQVIGIPGRNQVYMNPRTYAALMAKVKS